MPRTFFVDSPGSNCAGQHLCGGATTNAWAFAGVEPEHSTPATITGRVVDADGEAMPGVKIAASAVRSAATDAEGRYEVKVKQGGKYSVKASNGAGAFRPSRRRSGVRKGRAATANFKLVGCEAKAKDAKVHAFPTRRQPGPGSASCDDCSQNVVRHVDPQRSLHRPRRRSGRADHRHRLVGRGAQAAAQDRLADQRPPFGSPARLSRVVTVTGQAPGEMFSTRS